MGNSSVQQRNKRVIDKLRIQAANQGASSDVFLKHFGAKKGILLKEIKHPPHQPMNFKEGFKKKFTGRGS